MYLLFRLRMLLMNQLSNLRGQSVTVIYECPVISEVVLKTLRFLTFCPCAEHILWSLFCLYSVCFIQQQQPLPQGMPMSDATDGNCQEEVCKFSQPNGEPRRSFCGQQKKSRETGKGSKKLWLFGYYCRRNFYADFLPTR